jgi:hypothetical protein
MFTLIFNLSDTQRAYWYRIALALLAVASMLKLAGPDDIEVYAEVAMALLGIESTGLATKNTSTKGG